MILTRIAARRVALVLGLALGWGLAAAPAVAQTPEQPLDERRLAADGLVRLDQMNRGALLFRTDLAGYYVPAPLLSTKIDVDITGPIARTRLTQRFTNPAEVHVEGRYMFPLSDGAAVDTLKMRVNDRLIEGEIEEKQEAKRIYEEAKEQGYVASLLEQERDNVFSTSVANIAPGATIVIQIEYQEILAPRDGAYGLRIPLVVAPRYEPDADQLALPTFGPEGWEFQEVSAPGGAIATATVNQNADPEGSIRNPVEIDVTLVAGFPLGAVKSPFHKVVVTSTGVDSAKVTLDAPAPADRDFYLSWKAEDSREPSVTLFHEDVGEERHFLAVLAPPAASAVEGARRPREVIFVQDVSGSMSFGGENEALSSIAQARAGLERAVTRLHPSDSFNIVIFSDQFRAFYPEPVPVTAETVRDAVAQVRGLVADGGTEMLPALQFALRDSTPEDGRLRQVIFLTDGAVSNDREMIRLIGRELGQSRLFTVGIGSAPNSYFMNKAAEVGRGARVYIGDLNEVQERMSDLFAKIETPALVDLSVAVEGYRAAELFPSPTPDLYVGDPLAVAFTVDRGAATGAAQALALAGSQGDQAWTRRVALDASTPRPGVGKLAARRKIDDLNNERMAPDTTEEDVKRAEAEILRVALDNHLVSDFTSLVAVDKTPTRPADAPVVSADVPLNLPAGWDPAAFGLEEADPLQPAAEPAPILQEAALGRLTAAATQRAAAQSIGAPPPVGGLGWRSLALLGFGFVAVGALALMAARRWRAA